jgi:hypothetical protein
VVAVITDVVRDGKPVAGFAFNSNGRYACGHKMRERFIPRILRMDPKSLLDESGDNLDPEMILAVMRLREKIGGDAERSIGIGTIEVAVWDAVAKIAGKPLHRLLAERYGNGKVPEKMFCYVGGGWYWPGQTMRDLQDEMRRHLDAGYTMVKMKVGGLPLDEDAAASGGAAGAQREGQAGRRHGSSTARNRSPMPRRWRPSACAGRGAVRSARFYALGRDHSHYDARSRPARTCIRQDVQNPCVSAGAQDRDIVQSTRHNTYGICQYGRTIDTGARGLRRGSPFPAWRNSISSPSGRLRLAANPVGGFRLRRFRR